MPYLRFSFLILTSLLCGTTALAAEKPADQRGEEFFEKRIRPVLVKHCYECHAAEADDVGGNLLLDSASGMQNGGENGPAVVPKNIEKSLLIDALEYKSFEMPPDGQLPEDVIADFRRWIEMGAPDPRKGKPAIESNASKHDPKPPAELWSLKRLTEPERPDVKNVDWPRTDIDRFVLAKLESQGLEPVADAEPSTLLRRLSFDLVGLPPTLDHIERVSVDPSPATFEAIIDELLNSPQFGERWARHWLDVARFAESAGSSRDVLMPYAWKYRDYVIDAYNADLPYPQFITEQVAGDLLPAESAAERQRLRIATGLLAVGQKSLNGGNVELDIVDDQIDVIGKSVLGLTISCARCHDHKFDPIPTRDYYSLAGIFLSTDTRYGGGIKRPKNDVDKAKVYLTLGDREGLKKLADVSEKLGKLNQQKQKAAKKVNNLTKKLPKDWQAQREKLDERAAAENGKPLSKNEKALLKQFDAFENAQHELDRIQQRINNLNEKRKSIPPPEFAVGAREAGKIGDTRIRVRGEKNNQGDPAPRGFLQCVALDEQEVLSTSDLSKIDDSQSGRRQLAAWLTSHENPLTPRVAVNRIWLHLFGRGIVSTVDNFGSSGTQPTHPALLDYLAQRFIAENWSTKRLIREIVTSRSYQLSTNLNEGNYAKDPDNKYYWRMSRRRLEAEAIRDAMLAASGELDLSRPPFGSLVAKIGEGEVGRNLNTKPLRGRFPYRSVYLPIIRGILPESLKLFDFPEPSNPQSVRDSTTVPAQSLYFLNSPFVIRQAKQTAERIQNAAQKREQRIDHAYRLILNRPPTANEVSRIDAFVKESLAADKVGKADGDPLQSAWATVCQSLFASAEFRYLQ